ncbi:MAG: hypothetical protein JNK02_13160 [Planctomycetes bacterium]|nr:hypothetical protein [Planctomycetota bacterium]
MDPRTTLSSANLLAVVVVTGAALAAVALLGPVAFEVASDDLARARGHGATPPATLEARAAQAARLAGYAWVDRAQGVVALPIERAMELTVDELAREARAARGGEGGR